MKKQVVVLMMAAAMLTACKKEECAAPAAPECPAYEQYAPLDGQRTIYTLSNTQISFGGQLLSTTNSHQGESITIYIPDCGQTATLRVVGMGDYIITCNSGQQFPWMVEWQVP